MLSYQFDNVESAIFVFETYKAIKLHFTRFDYDFFKYNGKTKNKVKTQEQVNEFVRSKNCSLSYAIAKKHRNKHEIVEFLLANLEKNNTIWLDKLRDVDSEEIYLDWKKRQESLTYTFINDIKFILSHNKGFNQYFTKDSSGYCDIMKFLLKDEISIETVVILDWILNFIGKDIGDAKKDFILYDLKMRVKKYSTMFLHYHGFDNDDKKKFRDIVKEKAEDNLNILPF